LEKRREIFAGGLSFFLSDFLKTNVKVLNFQVTGNDPVNPAKFWLLRALKRSVMLRTNFSTTGY
jgi:hypothetical protein